MMEGWKLYGRLPFYITKLWMILLIPHYDMPLPVQNDKTNKMLRNNKPNVKLLYNKMLRPKC
jgi:hypothetical protein